jgi:predicted dehydrogenase
LKVKVAVIGAGHISRQHLSCLQQLPVADTVGVCDLSPAMAESAAEQFGVPRWFTDHREMLEELRPDVVHVGTPPRSHYALGRDALEAGAHVFIEKPITTYQDDLDSLLSLAKECERSVIEDHNYLFNREVQELLGRVADGTLGDVTHVEVVVALAVLGEGSRMADPNLPHPSLALPGGVVAEFLTHMAYLAHAFVGRHGRVDSSWTSRVPLTPLPCDEFRALIEAESGTASLSFSAHSQPDAFYVRVHGTRMRAEAHLWEPRLVLEREGGVPKPLQPMRNGLACGWQEARCGVASLWRKLAGGPGAYEGQWELLRRTYAALDERREMPIPASRIIEVNRLVNELGEQARAACGS